MRTLLPHHYLLILVATRIAPVTIAWSQHAQYRHRSGRIHLSTLSASSSQEASRRRETILIDGHPTSLISRTLPIDSDWSITVWEWEHPAALVEAYWDTTTTTSPALDPFGLVSWPGSVVAARALKEFHPENQTVLIVGAGVGVEAQAAAMMGAKHVIATDLHPTTLLQLVLGVEQNNAIDNAVVSTQILDLYNMSQTMPWSDVVVVADVLYNEDLAQHVVRRLIECWKKNPNVHILVTDSQRFVDILPALQQGLGRESLEWTEVPLVQFTGSGVAIDQDQTYNVTVRKLSV